MSRALRRRDQRPRRGTRVAEVDRCFTRHRPALPSRWAAVRLPDDGHEGRAAPPSSQQGPAARRVFPLPTPALHGSDSEPFPLPGRIHAHSAYVGSSSTGRTALARSGSGAGPRGARTHQGARTGADARRRTGAGLHHAEADRGRAGRRQGHGCRYDDGRERRLCVGRSGRPGQSLFQRIGYRSVVRNVAPVVDVVMAFQAMQLEEVSVTTALGIEREQRTLPYAAQTVSGDRLTQVPTTNVLSALQGNVAGLQVTNSSNPFGSARIVSRGPSSILGQNQPLIVVDGIPIDNSAATNTGYFGGSLGGYDVGNAAADIDATNVQSVSVLKGPNAAALY